MILVQRIVTTWTKRTRGAEGREARARLPTAYPLPDGALVAHTTWVAHTITRGEPDYPAAARLECLERFGRPNQSVSLVEERECLLLTFAGNGDCGAPQRPSRSATLGRETWARVRYNGRFIGYDDVWYEDKVVNIAFAMELRRELFVGAPALELDERVDLW